MACQTGNALVPKNGIQRETMKLPPSDRQDGISKFASHLHLDRFIGGLSSASICLIIVTITLNFVIEACIKHVILSE